MAQPRVEVEWEQHLRHELQEALEEPPTRNADRKIKNLTKAIEDLEIQEEWD